MLLDEVIVVRVCNLWVNASTPWTMINNAYGFRPFKLTVIDSGYSILGCGLIGGVLNLF